MSSSSSHLPPDLMEALMKDPVKRGLILQLLTKEKDNIENYKRELKKTPLKKVTKLHCESPTALHRRRALEQRDTGSEGSSSDISEIAPELKGPELPFEELLKGVVAYVEVRRDNKDRSEGIKAVMKLMGATVMDLFTNNVTHVIFKQIQKDYEEVIKDERRRRHTMMTPKTSISSYLTAQTPNDDESSRRDSKSPELTSDESDCGVIDGYITKKSKDSDLLLSSQFTDDNSKQSTSSTSLLSHVTVRNNRKTINVLSDMLLTPNVSESPRGKSQVNIAHSTPEKEKTKESTSGSSVMSSLRISMDTERTKSGLSSKNSAEKENRSKTTVRSTDTERTNSGLGVSKVSGRSRSSMLGGKKNSSKTSVSTSMSSLRLSESPSQNVEEKRSSAKLTPGSDDIIPKTPSTGSLQSAKGKETVGKNSKPTPSSSSNSAKGNSGNTRNTRIRVNQDSCKASSMSDLLPPNTRTDSKKVESLPQTKKSRRRILDDSDSDFDMCKTEDKQKRNRRVTSVIPPETERSRIEDNTTRRTRKSTVELFPKASLLLEKPKLSRNGQRSTSEASLRCDEVKKVRSDSVESLTSNGGEESSKEQTPSPAKKKKEETVSTKKTRKLYVPNDITGFCPFEEDKEREEYVKQKSQKSPEGVFLNPNILMISPPSSKQKFKSNSDLSSESESELVKTETKTKKGKIPPKRDSSADEQRELLILLDRVTAKQTRHSERLSLSQTKPKYTFSSESDRMSSSSLPISPIKRRSTLDFTSLTQSQQKRRLKLDPKRTESIVCTKMHRYEVINFERTVTKLGRFFVEDKVTGKTTHLVAGEAKRTINMLKAIARGCWILNHDWLLKSEEAGKWLNEEDYELTEFSPAVQQCRLQREAFGPLYSMDIFKDCGAIYVSKGSNPKTGELKELIAICKGKLTNIYRNAAIVVGEYIEKEGATCVHEMWVLDSILYNKLKSVKKYLIKPASQGDSPHF